MKGIYILILHLPSCKELKIGKLGRLSFESGYYAYVGSALFGEHRLMRHIKNLQKGKVLNPHWHIDYLISHCEKVGWFFAECHDPKKEGEVANALSKKLSYIDNFGSSDSNAPSHLFKSKKLKKLEEEIQKVWGSVGLAKIYSEKDSII